MVNGNTLPGHSTAQRADRARSEVTAVGLRLISEDEVMDIICKHENRAKQQHMMVYEITKLNGCIATEEQMLQILADKELQLED